ncbi:putative pentatricopeptide repeat-containing protein [Hibiscus syriacus]|uniref:Pentatricopeptide repeat-containing protein n=1 Tax=Hibiscus syriacus TaxID=106335 RepID=A0A6A3BHK7_HIBSY|nr:pyrrolidone-carboxylate peptidase-like isoform X1 [Hibiscus syriacus]KAE8716550.1 putative pentatricopeptide repeat-containing protein [Hibiscus syriacus]
MGTEQPKSVTINVTGFKKFQGVAENPTETIVNNLTSFVQRKGLLPAGVTLGSCTVLETAGDGALPVLYKVLESGTSGIHTKKEHIVWLHLGVDGGAEKFALERQAVNEATFFCPDELGWQPMRQPIVAEDGGTSRKRETTCSIEVILKFLKDKGYDVRISNDAGLFVCNYVYYHSLRFAEQKGHKSLFVHVPLFSVINEETQMQFVASLLEAIASTC